MNKIIKILLLLFYFFSSTAQAYTGANLKSQIEIARDSGGLVNIVQGTYIIDTPIVIDTFGKNINISFPPGTRIQGGDDTHRLTSSVINFRGVGASVGEVIISGRGTLNCVNCSDGITQNRSTNGGSGISVQNMYGLQISGMSFIAGSDGDGIGDSGITTVNVKTIRIFDNEFIGWDDVAVYISGNELETGNDLGQGALIYNNLFKNNHVSMSSKRSYRHVHVEKNIFDENFVDISAFPTGNGDSGKEINVVNNSFYNVRRNIVDTRGNFRWVKMTNNDICRSYYKVKKSGAAVFINKSNGKGSIITDGNRIDQRYLGGAAVYSGKNIVHNDIMLNGC